MRLISILISILYSGSVAFAGTAGTYSENHYSMGDFVDVKKIDAHVHANTSKPGFIEAARKNGFTLLSVNVDYPDFPPINEQLEIATELGDKYPDEFKFATTFSMSGFGGLQWKTDVQNRIDRSVNNGAVAVKVWKNIGMSYKDKNDRLVMIDNPEFDDIFKYLASENIPLIGHQGEPKNCWLPIEKMTVNNDKKYFEEHPQYHMFLHPEQPSYEHQMLARNNMLDKHGDMAFVGAHLASIEWSVDILASFLEKYPNAVVDLAARMGQVQYQSKMNYKKVREFFINYQDRVLYATDLTHEADAKALEFENWAQGKWLSDWRYLNTGDEMEAPELDGKFSGLELPKNVVDKIYHLNAERFFFSD